MGASDYAWTSGDPSMMTVVPMDGNHFKVDVSFESKTFPESYDRIAKVTMNRDWLVILGLGTTIAYPREKVASLTIREFTTRPEPPGEQRDSAG